jgi:hypothetical protein
MIEHIPIKEILLATLTAFSSFLIWKIQFQKNKIKSIQNQLAERKYQMYSDLIYILFDVTNTEKKGNKSSETELRKKVLSVKKNMFIYAPDKIFKKFTKWLLEVSNTDSLDHFKTYFEIMKMMREDMGHIKTNITLEEFMLFYMQNKLEYEKFKKSNNWQ